MDTAPKSTLIGAPVRRVEDARLLQGRGRYVADVVLPRMAHVAFLRSPHAHARIARIDTVAARVSPGVLTCLTAGDIGGDARPVRAASRMKGYVTTAFPPLAHGKTRFAGEAVAAVVADSRYTAEDALDRIAIDYAPLPAVCAPRAAMGADSPRVHEEAGTNVLLTRAFIQGDTEAAFRDAALVVGDRFRFRRHAGVAIENRACVADWEPAGASLTLWSTTQV
ncbi:MAG: xanthine dehydrogenase family protein molybdopterin-binding subunit, partial [Candidatus Rokuibacteriota bacterium]